MGAILQHVHSDQRESIYVFKLKNNEAKEEVGSG